VGTRVLERLVDMRIPVVVVERNPDAPGVSLARKRNVPVVIGDISQPEVYRSARIERSQTLMALTSNDSVNLEAVLYARERRPDLRVVLRLFDDAFASTVYRALRASYPQARTRSRSVSYLAAPAFAAAMMGRQVLAAIPVERQMLLVATVNVRGRRALEGQSVGGAFRPDGWRVVGLLSRDGHLTWGPAAGRVLTVEDRVVVVATREGLGLLLQRPSAAAAPGTADAKAPESDGEQRTGAESRPEEGVTPEAGPGAPAVPESAGPPTPGRFRDPGSRERPGRGVVPGAAQGRPAPRLRRPATGPGSAIAPVPLPRLPRAQPYPPYPSQQQEPAEEDQSDGSSR
jgi:Trk K+ transport system NAD-binding subunit